MMCLCGHGKTVHEDEASCGGLHIMSSGQNYHPIRSCTCSEFVEQTEPIDLNKIDKSFYGEPTKRGKGRKVLDDAY